MFKFIFLSFVTVVLASDHSPVSSCFAKVRTLAILDTEFRQNLDHAAKISRLDSLIETLIGKVDKLCSQEEKDYVIDYLDKHQRAILITENVVKNLTNQEKDHLNVWNNLNDTVSQQQMFLHKFHALSRQDQNVLRDTYNKILNTFAASSLDPDLSSALSLLNTMDQKQIQLYAREGQYQDIKHLIHQKLDKSDLHDKQKSKAFEFLSKLYSRHN
uniref:Uncharacterized protein n=1 Tax=Panagrolaimus superbus TaxID=310955 RepID=A0A914Y3G5_9BILA